MIPPQPDFGLADTAALDAARLTVATTPVTWPASDLPRRAGVSAFGFGGTGVHLVVEEHAAPPVRPAPVGEPYELVLTARDRAGLVRYARDVARTIAEDGPPPARVADTLARRAPLRERLALVARDAAEAAARLTAAAAALEAGHAVESAPTPAGPPSAARRTPPCTLPPSPLAPRRHWVVDDAAREVAQPARPEPPARRAGGREAAPTPPAPSAAPGEDAASIVLEEVSRTGVFPLADLGEGMTLVAGLGFDSLMLQELAVNIGKRAPAFRSEDLFAPGLTVGGLIALLDPGRTRHEAPGGRPPARRGRPSGAPLPRASTTSRRSPSSRSAWPRSPPAAPTSRTSASTRAPSATPR